MAERVKQLDSWFKNSEAGKEYKFGEVLTGRKFGAPGKALLKRCGLLGEDAKDAYLLDNACGTGIITRFLHEHGNPPKILCTDSSEPMVAAVKQEIASQPWPNTTVRVADSQAFDLPDNEFDYVITSFAIMAMPKPEDALKECLRVVKPGGTLGFAHWKTLGWLPHVQAAAERIDGSPTFPSPLDFWKKAGHSWHDAAWTKTLLEGLGYQDVQADDFPFSVEIADQASYVANINKFLMHMTGNWPTAQKEQMSTKLSEVLREQFGDGPVPLHSEAVIITGRKAA